MGRRKQSLDVPTILDRGMMNVRNHWYEIFYSDGHRQTYRGTGTLPHPAKKLGKPTGDILFIQDRRKETR